MTRTPSALARRPDTSARRRTTSRPSRLPLTGVRYGLVLALALPTGVSLFQKPLRLIHLDKAAVAALLRPNLHACRGPEPDVRPNFHGYFGSLHQLQNFVAGTGIGPARRAPSWVETTLRRGC